MVIPYVEKYEKPTRLEMLNKKDIEPAPRPSYLSKTNLSNLITALGVYLGSLSPWIAELLTPETVAILFTIVNIVMRRVSRGKVYFW